ncbi:cupin domain-containing protein [Mucilaginibacter sp. ZT4R22]|uniref:Cupin domain-containing protein n=1 Tax=Mucilaginibacter pankratovii TaxID=2772110 RepID=A0ABR7WWV6_9SPHI|nr:cupin domain-containing protein [Mucilaginibacter pankratovii]MBD1366759.1 cupin domain-containing protein [Mucilaginibacter pankratovii]
MQRKKFLQTGLGAAALLALGKTAAANAPAKKPFKIAAGKGRFNESFLYKGKNPNDIKISGKDTDSQIAMFEYIGYEKTGPSLHVHFHQDEVFYVIEGNYRFVVGYETMMMNPGDTIFLPRNIPHTWIQLTDKGKLVYFVQPAGKAEDFFRTMNNLKVAPTKEEVDKIHEACGMKVMGPPLSL